TVSKVLRQKDKYLFPDDGSRSPIKRSKGKFPDIERALSNWARNHQRQGLPLNDSIIRDKARFFATTVGSSDSHAKVNSSSWLEKSQIAEDVRCQRLGQRFQHGLEIRFQHAEWHLAHLARCYRLAFAIVSESGPRQSQNRESG
ncbi:MAG: hypothetical protein LQ347_007065, partial [Umbilicaria vellea]